MEWTNDHRQWYREVYLRSQHWADLVTRKLRANPKCELCGKKGRLDIHHINYKNIFDVTIDDLASLCRGCHNREHEIRGLPKRVKISYSDYYLLPSEIARQIALIRAKAKTQPQALGRYIVKNALGLNSFYESLCGLFGDSCFNCKCALVRGEIVMMKRSGQGGIAGQLLACSNCSKLAPKKIKRFDQTQQLILEFQKVQEMVLARREEALTKWIRGEPVAGYSVSRRGEAVYEKMPRVRIS